MDIGIFHRGGFSTGDTTFLKREEKAILDAGFRKTYEVTTRGVSREYLKKDAPGVVVSIGTYPDDPPYAIGVQIREPKSKGKKR